MAEKLVFRKDVDEKLTWDLSLIYATEQEMLQDFDKAKKLGEKLTEYKGRLQQPQVIIQALEEYRELVELMTLLSHYTSLAVSVDYYNETAQQKDHKVNAWMADTMSRLSFIESELLELDEAVLDATMEQAGSCRNYLKDLKARKAYQLHPEAERVLAALNQPLGAGYEIYEITKLADIQFPDFKVNGKEYPLGYSLFEDDYEYDSRTEVRRAAFNAFSNKIRQYVNVTATAYNTTVQKEKILSDLRGFRSVYDSLLFSQKVERELYDRQIDLIMEKLAPHMRKYAKLLQRIHGLDKMTYADLHLTVDPEYVPSISIEDSKEYVMKGLSILGEDYVKMIQEAYDNRWVDFAQNQGKSTGGFCASPYGRNSFILMSWNGRMSDVFTLAHELGHAGHFRLCNGAQSIFDTDVSTYFVEAPSTMNELLMAHYLLKTSDDLRFRRFVLANMISNTYYHNFVTHLLEAAYQREVYKIVDAGGSVQADTLNRIMKETLEKFWGDTVELTEGAELTWMRQPHYYMGLYSYTYSAGLTIATQVCKRIEKEGQPAVDDWKRVLTAGSTKTPKELALMAGVDISTDAPLLDTIDTIGTIIDEIIDLTDKLF